MPPGQTRHPTNAQPSIEPAAPRAPGTATEPIAIIGIGCRFPGGAHNPEQFWDLLTERRDALGAIPAERWDLRRFFDPHPGVTGKTQVREAGFLQQSLTQFDPAPFGIAPREAEGLDPQQRLLLEVAWEALEDAGQDLSALRGSSTGVFMGGFCLDNLLIRLSPLNRDQIDQHTAASSTMTMLSNRLSYIFDLRGPSISIDTACSSSLAALHFACQSLSSGACDMALAGGVNIMLVPEFFLTLSHARMLSPLGRSMAFDERAAGYARGEGAGIVVLKPLSRALADGDTVRALIRASGVNQDGRTQGITLPNADAQQALMRDVYRRAGVRPGEVSYIEAHGTGTRAGDKAELESIGRVMSEGRASGERCLVGAVKSNIGHLEAASGMAGLIKAVLVLEHRSVPPNLHLQVPNPDIPWQDLCLRLPDEMTPLLSQAEGSAQPYAAVNSFGYGGTNVHVLLQASDDANECSVSPDPAVPTGIDAPVNVDAERCWLLPLSACDADALKATAAAYAQRLRSPGVSVGDVVRGAATRRTHLPQRLALVGQNAASLAEALEQCAQGDFNGAQCWRGEAQQHAKGPVFVYSGMGPQWWGMGRQLMETEPVFRAAIDEVDALFFAQAGWSLRDAIGMNQEQSRISETQVAQPANFALQVALTRLLAHWGVRPSAVVGHSIGEVAAAWSCGALSLADAVAVAHYRSRYQQTLASAGGGMLAVGLNQEGASNLLRDFPRVAIAAMNAARSLTLSGPLADLEAIALELDRYEVFQRLLQVEIAYHSPFMDAIREPLIAALATLTPQAPAIPWYSSVTAQAQTAAADAHYWWRNVREPVRFQESVEKLAEAGYQDYLEVGPHPVLQSSLREILVRHANCSSASTLHRQQAEAAAMRGAAAALHVRGHALHWDALSAPGKPVKLPTYPWQRQEYWKESRRSREDKQGRPGPACLWQTLASPLPAWQVDINANFFPWLNDHRVGGRIVFPGAAYVAAGLALQQQAHPDTVCAIENLVLHDMLSIEPGQPRYLVSMLTENAGGFKIFSHCGEADDGAWRLHAHGSFQLGTMAGASLVDMNALRERCTVSVDADTYYRDLARMGLEYGPTFRRIASLTVGAAEVLIALNDAHGSVTNDPLPPTTLDALFQGLFAAMPSALAQRAMVPVSIKRLTLHAPLDGPLFAHLMLEHHSADEVRAKLRLLSPEGKVMASIDGVRCKAISRSTPLIDPTWFHELSWKALAPAAPAPIPQAQQRGWLVLGHGELAQALADQIELDGLPVLNLPLPEDEQLAPLRARMSEACRQFLGLLPADFNWQILLLLDEANSSSNAHYRTALRHTNAVLAMAQAIAAQADVARPPPVLCLLTRRAQCVDAQDNSDNPGGAASWGLGRVIVNEMPELICRSMDLGSDSPEAEAGLIYQHLSSAPVVDECAVRQGQIVQLALSRCDETRVQLKPALRTLAAASPLLLNGRRPEIDLPFWREGPAPVREPGQVLVEVDSWIPTPDSKASKDAPSALEWHGRIVNGAGMHEDGGRVWGVDTLVAARTIATQILVDHRSIHAVKASALPGAVLPILHAWHALVLHGRLTEGQTVLLHGAANEASIVWAQVARHLGARLLVSLAHDQLGAPWVEELGAVDVLDASALDYGRQLLERSGATIDLALVLTGTGAAGLVEALAEGPRNSGSACVLIAEERLSDGMSSALLEAGVPLLPCNLAHFLRAPESLMHALAWLDTLPTGAWHAWSRVPAIPLSELDSALRLARAGQLVRLTRSLNESIPALPADRSYCGLRRQASYLITGGTSGFGLALAEWLANQGVAHIVLASRRGKVAPSDQARLDRLSEQCRVSLSSTDVSEAAAVSALLSDLAADTLPLRGVFHCAMTLSDGWINTVTGEDVDRVLAPKVAGALHLHHGTRELDLDCFVLFSSVSALIGNPGQACYAAANACLDAIAHWRHGLGLPALSVNWGAIADVGVAARDERLLEHLRQAGMHSLNSSAALAALGALLLNGSTQAGVFSMDWASWKSYAPVCPPRLVGLLPSDQAEHSSQLDGLLRQLANVEPEARVELLSMALRRQLALILRAKESQISVTQAVRDLGLDSLLTLEWVLSINQEWGLNISGVELINAANLTELAGKLHDRLLK
ncbi:MAG: SDR family NAD(P)-dependent oxidoreductase [Pseudomonadota bacterium]